MTTKTPPNKRCDMKHYIHCTIDGSGETYLIGPFKTKQAAIDFGAIELRSYLNKRETPECNIYIVNEKDLKPKILKPELFKN